MGKPRELTGDERAELFARGYRPIEVWIAPNEGSDFWEEVEAECREIGNADENAEIDLFTEQSIQDVFRLIDEEEDAMGRR